MKRPTDEPGLIARIEDLRKKQELAEADEIRFATEGNKAGEGAMRGDAARYLLFRRRLQKRLDELRAPKTNDEARTTT